MNALTYHHLHVLSYAWIPFCSVELLKAAVGGEIPGSVQRYLSNYLNVGGNVLSLSQAVNKLGTGLSGYTVSLWKISVPLE